LRPSAQHLRPHLRRADPCARVTKNSMPAVGCRRTDREGGAPPQGGRPERDKGGGRRACGRSRGHRAHPRLAARLGKSAAYVRERLLVLRLPGQSGRRSPLASGLGQHRAAELYATSAKSPGSTTSCASSRPRRRVRQPSIYRLPAMSLKPVCAQPEESGRRPQRRSRRRFRPVSRFG
jgi:hypothetical protein